MQAERQAELAPIAAPPRSPPPAATPAPPDAPVQYFRLMMDLALLGYVTSEIRYRQAMRYI